MTSFIHSVVTVHFLGARLGARLAMALNTYTLPFSPLHLSRLRTLITTPRSHPLISGPVSVKLTTALSHPGHWSPLLRLTGASPSRRDPPSWLTVSYLCSPITLLPKPTVAALSTPAHLPLSCLPCHLTYMTTCSWRGVWVDTAGPRLTPSATLKTWYT